MSYWLYPRIHVVYKGVYRNQRVVGRAGGEIIFPTAVPDPQYELICIQPIRATWYEYEWLASSE